MAKEKEWLGKVMRFRPILPLRNPLSDTHIHIYIYLTSFDRVSLRPVGRGVGLR